MKNTVVPIKKWTFQDYVERKCLLSQVDMPKPDSGTARRLAREYAPDAVRKLIHLLECSDPAIALKAANSLLDRGFGRPDQSMTVDSTQTTVVEMPWITAQRLAYRMDQRISQDILDKPQDVSVRQYPGESKKD